MILFYFYHPVVKYTKQPCLFKKKKKREKEGKQKRLFFFYKISLKVEHGDH